MKRTLWIGLTIAVICALLYPQVVDAADQRRIARNIFPLLKVDQGARMAAMGGSFVAISDDINAIFSNVAGLTHIERAAFTLGYTRWLLSDHMVTGGFAYSTPQGTFGLNVLSFRPEPFEENTIFQPQGTGREPALGSISIGVAFARKLTDKLSVGALVRWSQETLDTDRLSALDLSVSTLFYTGFRSLRLGMAFENLGQDKTLIEQTARMPVTFSVAAAMEIMGAKGEPVYLTVTGENYYATDLARAQYRVGGELWFQDAFALRGGYKINFDEESYTLGAGVKFQPAEGRDIRADFAYCDFGNYLDAPLRFTLTGSF